MNTTLNISSQVHFDLTTYSAYCGSLNLSTYNSNTLWNTGIISSQITATTSGTYWASISNSCGIATDTIVLTQLPAPIVNLGNDTSVCNGQSFTLDATNTNSTYYWQDNSTDSTFLVSTSGTYAVTVTNQSGCMATDTITINTSSGVALYVVPVSTSCGNNNGSVSVNVSSGSSPFVYLWSNADSVSSIINLPAGTYQVTVTDVGGCTGTASAVVNSSTTNPVTITSNKPIMCSGDTAYVCAPAGYSAYLWNSGQTDICIYATQAGNYYVTATDANNCTVVSNHLVISVYPLSPVSVSVNGDTLNAYNAVTYQWYFNNTSINGATDSSYIASQTGNYTVEISDTNGCYVFSNAVNVVVSGINTIANGQSSVIIYPNPSNEFVNLVISKNLIGSRAKLTDVTGREVMVVQLSAINNQLSIAQLASGVYYLEINVEGVKIVKQIVKQ